MHVCVVVKCVSGDVCRVSNRGPPWKLYLLIIKIHIDVDKCLIKCMSCGSMHM